MMIFSFLPTFCSVSLVLRVASNQVNSDLMRHTLLTIANFRSIQPASAMILRKFCVVTVHFFSTRGQARDLEPYTPGFQVRVAASLNQLEIFAD
jgi:hypothetical protein